jgi:hypothetical protein
MNKYTLGFLLQLCILKLNFYLGAEIAKLQM